MSTLAAESRSQPNNMHWEDVHAVVEPQIRADGFHIWPFVRSFPVDVRGFLFGRQGNIRLTRHDYFELVYVYSGSATYEIGERKFTVIPADLIVINGELFHRLREITEAPFKAVVLYFLPDLLRAVDTGGEHVQYLMPFLLQDRNFPHVVSKSAGITEEIFGLMQQIRLEILLGTERSRIAATTYLEMILVLLMNHYRDHLTIAGTLDRSERTLARLRPLFDFIDVHYREHIPLSRATALVGMSKPHFMRSFKKLTGQSFDTYLNHFRIAKAQMLLSSTDMSISAIGQEVGFGDQSYFGLVFRRLVQLTPREYRKSLQSE